jgi:hypothetical protein
MRRPGLEATGVIGVWLQLACLLVAIIPAAVARAGAARPAAAPLGARVLAAGLAASRAGLWLFDLAVGQMLQERVPPQELGAPPGRPDEQTPMSACMGNDNA